MILGDLGADVIKIEPPEGDATRGWGPPWVGDRERRDPDGRVLPGGQPQQAGIRLDLKTAAGGDVLRRLLADADVLVENLRPGSLDRLGFDDTTLRPLNPALVHLAISGYGRTGPPPTGPATTSSSRPSAGSCRSPATPDDDGGRPTKVGVAISDVVTGLYRRDRHPGRARSAATDDTAAASGSTCRCSARPSRSSSTRPRTRS